MTTKARQIQETAESLANSDLPEGWTAAKLEAISTLITKGTTPTSLGFKYQDKGIAFVRVENLSDGYIDRSTISTYIDREADEALRRSRLHAGDLLFSIAGTIGRTALVGPEDLPANTNQALAIVRGTSPVVLPKYLMFALSSTVTQEQAGAEARGGSMNNISLGDVRDITVPIAPLAEQKCIVVKSETLLAERDRMERRILRVRTILKRFRQAVLAAACSGKLTEDWREEHPGIELSSELEKRLRGDRRAEWTTRELARMQSKGSHRSDEKWRSKYLEPESPDATEEVPDLPATWCEAGIELLLSLERRGMKTGPFGSSLKKSEHQKRGIPVLGIENIGEMKFVEGSKIHISQSKADELAEFDAQPGDILISRSGTVGEVCVVPDGLGEARISTNIMRLTLRNSGMLPTFFCYLFNGSPFVLGQVAQLCGGSTRDFLNQTILLSILFPIPSLQEQQEIVRRVEALFKLADAIEKRVEAATLRAERLTQAILAKAFRGELVAREAELARREGREYEPASVLLERIKKESEKASSEKPSSEKPLGTKTRSKLSTVS